MPKLKPPAPYFSDAARKQFVDTMRAKYSLMSDDEKARLEIAANMEPWKGELRMIMHNPLRRVMMYHGHEFAWDVDRELWVLYYAHFDDGTRYSNKKTN